MTDDLEAYENEIARLQDSADFWRARANKFELALRKIEAVNDVDVDVDERSSNRWDIAQKALKMEPPLGASQ